MISKIREQKGIVNVVAVIMCIIGAFSILTSIIGFVLFFLLK